MRALWLCCGSLAGALALWWPAFRSPQATGFGDWQYFHHMWETGYVALSRYGEWPLWDPYHCGGITLFGNPQNQLYSPLFFVSLLTGPTLAAKLFVVLHAAAGFGGMFVFARRHQALSRWPAVVASAAWAGSGFFAWHGGGGHSAFMPFYLAPLLLIALRAAIDDLRHAATLAAGMTLLLLEGGVYPFPCLSLLLAFDGAAALLSRRGERRRVLLAGALAVGLTLLLGAIRLLPIADELARNPRTMPSEDSLSLAELLTMLTARSHAWRFEGHPFVWPEYGSFVGFLVLALAALALPWALRQRRVWLLSGLLLFGSLTLGDHGPLSPWALLHRLPLFDSLRVPSRFTVLTTFFLALLAGHGLQQLARWLNAAQASARLRLSAIAGPLIAAAVVADLLQVNTATGDQWTGPPIRSLTPSERHHLSAAYPYGRYYASMPRMGIGSTGCYEAMNFTVARGLWTGDLPQARVVAGHGEVHGWGRTTSRAFAVVTMHAPGAVVFNQNHAPGWQSTIGRVHADAHGRLRVSHLPRGQHRIELRYRPPTLWPALSLSGLGVVGAAALLLGAGRVRRRPSRASRIEKHAEPG